METMTMSQEEFASACDALTQRAERPTVPEVLPLLDAYYRFPKCGLGGVVHIVTEDDNTDPASIAWCVEQAQDDARCDEWHGGAGPAPPGDRTAPAALLDHPAAQALRAARLPGRLTMAEPLEIMGQAEIAELLDVKPTLVAQWYRRGKLPEPDARLRQGPVWRTSTIEAWLSDLSRAVPAGA